MKEAWEKYLSAKPTTRDIAWLFFCNDQEGINELAWEELGSRKDIEIKDLMMPILYCRNPRWIRTQAWEMLLKMNPGEDELKKITSHLNSSDPIVKDILSKHGPTKEYLLQKVKEASEK